LGAGVCSLSLSQGEEIDMGKVLHFLRSEDGPTAVEYAVMCALIIVVCVGAITSLGQSASTKFKGIADSLK
jgi:pilus assembly protein Flp/PilA